MALGINNIVGVSGMFIGLVLGGILAPIDWRLVFLISVPVGLFGTVWAYLELRGAEHAAAGARSTGRATSPSPSGWCSLMVGVTYGIQPDGGHTIGWTSPRVLAVLAGGRRACWSPSWSIERRVRRPDVPPAALPHPRLHVRHARRRSSPPWRAAA